VSRAAVHISQVDDHRRRSLEIRRHDYQSGTHQFEYRSRAIRPFIGCAYRQRSPWSGEICEVLVYSRALPDEERKSVEQFLKRKYGVAD